MLSLLFVKFLLLAGMLSVACVSGRFVTGCSKLLVVPNGLLQVLDAISFAGWASFVQALEEQVLR